MRRLIQSFWLFFAGSLLPAVTAFAAEAAPAASAGAGQWGAPAVGLGMAIAVFSAAAAQGRIAAAYMEGASRNPGAVNVMRTPLILSLVFVETLVLFTFLVVLLLSFKIPGV